jgi:hypothetical protein
MPNTTGGTTKETDMKHCIKIQMNSGHYQVYATSVEAAKVVASLAFNGGAQRVWVDGELTAGPINELLDTEVTGALISLV